VTGRQLTDREPVTGVPRDTGTQQLYRVSVPIDGSVVLREVTLCLCIEQPGMPIERIGCDKPIAERFGISIFLLSIELLRAIEIGFVVDRGRRGSSQNGDTIERAFPGCGAATRCRTRGLSRAGRIGGHAA